MTKIKHQKLTFKPHTVTANDSSIDTVTKGFYYQHSATNGNGRNIERQLG